MLTPVDIENKMFKKVKIGGYDINEVEEFLEELIVDYETLYKENVELKDKIEKTDETAEYYSTLEKGVSQTIENSQIAADQIKEKALREAEAMKEAAVKEAEEMKKAALKEAEDIKSKATSSANCGVEEIKLEIRSKELELEKIKKEMQIYKIKVRSMLEAQMQILADEEE